jgi:hypothetical protein
LIVVKLKRECGIVVVLLVMRSLLDVDSLVNSESLLDAESLIEVKSMFACEAVAFVVLVVGPSFLTNDEQVLSLQVMAWITGLV